MKRRVTFVEEHDGVEFNLTWEPVEFFDMLKTRTKTGEIVVGYLANDSDCRDVDDLMGDCMGKLYSFHRHAPKDDYSNGLAALGNNSEGEADLATVHRKYWGVVLYRYIEAVIRSQGIAQLAEDLSASWEREFIDESDEVYVRRVLQYDADLNDYEYVIFEDIMHTVLCAMWNEQDFFPGDKDAQVLACYEHGGQHWSLSGSGYQCMWDTCNQAGVWVPDKHLREQLDTDEKNGLDRATQARLYCKQFLESYNSIINGDVYGAVVEWYDKDGCHIETSDVWGCVGSKHAGEELQSTFEWYVKQLETDHQHA